MDTDQQPTEREGESTNGGIGAAPPLHPGYSVVSTPKSNPMDAMASADQPQGAPPLPPGYSVVSQPEETPIKPPPTEPPPAPLENSAQQQEADKTPPEEHAPGFLTVAGRGIRRKATEAATNLATGMQIALPQGVGGKTMEQSY